MLGRGTRLASGKDHLLVLDLVDIAAAGVANVNTLFGLPPKLDSQGRDILTIKDEVEDSLVEVSPEYLESASSIADIWNLAEEFNPLLAARLPEYIHATMTWVKTGYGYALSLGKGTLGIVVNLLGQATLKLHWPGESVRFLGQFPNEQQAITRAEAMVKADFADSLPLVNRNAAWRHRNEPPTEKQLYWCERMKLRVPAGATKADVQVILSRAFSQGRVKLVADRKWKRAERETAKALGRHYLPKGRKARRVVAIEFERFQQEVAPNV